MSSEKKFFATSYLFGLKFKYSKEPSRKFVKKHINETYKNYFHGINNNDKKINIKNKFNEFNLPKISILNLLNQIFDSYRSIGFKLSNINPIFENNFLYTKEVDPYFYNLNKDNLKNFFIRFSNNRFLDYLYINLDKRISYLKEIYCRYIGSEFFHIQNNFEKNWIIKYLENNKSIINENFKRKDILYQLIKSKYLEEYLSKKYVGQKRFSLEGSDSFIVCINEIINNSINIKLKHLVIGMAHRGRLNFLVNIMGKKIKDLFNEFNHNYENSLDEGDVKYHSGFDSIFFYEKFSINLSLLFNPSHLEIIGPVVQGYARSIQDEQLDNVKSKILPIVIHGDASISGQGVVLETLNLSKTDGYNTNGTIHIVINNQIGFTTSKLSELRSSEYCTDILKLINAPIFHVNGNYPESVSYISKLIFEYRQKFKKDVILDIFSFRKFGHNEQDTPFLTQPFMYKNINKNEGVEKIYSSNLINKNYINHLEINKMKQKYINKLKNFDNITNFSINDKNKWIKYLNNKFEFTVNTKLSISKIKFLGKKITSIPNNFYLHPLIYKILNERKSMIKDNIFIDWGFSESLAFASILTSGFSIRFTGQDSCRGTFAHRHAVWSNQNINNRNFKEYIPINNICENQKLLNIINSTLSEESVLAFEYGYSNYSPNKLNIWEAQFGDFVNGAQVVIDQFISSGECKWGKKSSMVMMLPHGYEGQGPEHSSARIERFLQLCSNRNIQISQPTNTSQIFHLIRKQVFAKFRKPLIIFMPKSLLRNKITYSSIYNLQNSYFLNIINDNSKHICKKNILRILICSGKIYYDLMQNRKKYLLEKCDIIRIENLYPFDNKLFYSELSLYINLVEIIWVQDEPKNQGVWNYIKKYIIKNMKINHKLLYVGRDSSDSTSTGFIKRHFLQRKKINNESYKNNLKNYIFIK